MTKLNPIFLRDMRLRVRSIKFGISLMVYNGILLFIALFGFEMKFNININSTIDYSSATDIYMILVCLEIIMTVFMVPSLTSASISSEREKQTLDILLSTGIRPVSIITGKLAETVSMIMLLVFSSLPVLSIVFTIGGVSVLSEIEFLMIILVTSIFIGSIGVMFSACLKKTIYATLWTFGAIIFICFLTIAIVVAAYLAFRLFGLTDTLISSGYMQWTSFMLMINPIVNIAVMLSKQYGNVSVVSSLVTNMGLSENLIGCWQPVSITIQLCLSALCIYIASSSLNPLSKRKRKSTKYSKKNNTQKV